MLDRAEYEEAAELIDLGAELLVAYAATDPEDVPLSLHHDMAGLAASYGIAAMEMGSPLFALHVAQQVAVLKQQLEAI
jgi:hypothetical protein